MNNNDPNASLAPLPATASAPSTGAQSFPAAGPIAAVDSNLGAAVLGGAAAALVGAILWAAITVTTKFQIGFMAVGVGFLVAWAVRTLGKGHTPVYGVIGATFALLGCLLGNLLSACGFIAAAQGGSVVQITLKVLSSPAIMAQLLQATFDGMDVLFYAIAVYEGYRFARRPAGA